MKSFKVKCYDFFDREYILVEEFVCQTDDNADTVSKKFLDLIDCDKVDATPIKLVMGYEVGQVQPPTSATQ